MAGVFYIETRPARYPSFFAEMSEREGLAKPKGTNAVRTPDVPATGDGQPGQDRPGVCLDRNNSPARCFLVSKQASKQVGGLVLLSLDLESQGVPPGFLFCMHSCLSIDQGKGLL